MGALLLAPTIIKLTYTHKTGILWLVLLLYYRRSTPIVVVRRLSTLFEVDLLILLVRGNRSLRFVA